MIKFTKNEIKYIKENFKKYIDIKNCKDDGFKRHYLNLDKYIIEYIHTVSNNMEKINNDADINKKCVEALIDCDGLWHWKNNGEFTIEEITDYVGSKEYSSIYNKIYNIEDEN